MSTSVPLRRSSGTRRVRRSTSTSSGKDAATQVVVQLRYAAALAASTIPDAAYRTTTSSTRRRRDQLRTSSARRSTPVATRPRGPMLTLADGGAVAVVALEVGITGNPNLGLPEFRFLGWHQPRLLDPSPESFRDVAAPR